MAVHQRPLSPHLQVYRPQLTSVLSIMHRVTGVFLGLAAFALSAWLVAVAGDGDGYDTFVSLASSLPGCALAAALVFSLMFHLFNGVRHLIWDAGWGFEIAQVYATGWSVVALSVVCTALVVFLALRAGGAA